MSRSVALLSVVAAFATSAFAQAQDIHVVDVPLVTGAQIQFFRLPWPSTRFVVKRMVQDNHGFLWLSAEDGLRRYDSYDFVRVSDSQNPDSIGFTIAESLMKDRSGRIWIGAYDSLGLYDPATGSFKQYRSPDEACGTVAIAHDITEDQDGPRVARNRRRPNSSGSGHVENDLLPAAVRSLDWRKACHRHVALARRHSLDHQ
jgi:streptogramin lyase